ncbi:aspartate/glutamate racemase family protein [Liquorilactobacillus oeni]|uniref:Aspartate racemase n=1 Tax=Liquorilactobacillus oeni DSM 19972 TaxID=1423777 RepID=A0A0R1MC51_9LACO|nr:amino acid racemase [Liquorilactobacillus oeni]KRL05728.1 aspartate racemase [Liquorilactobacillus oeni DSM 19972]
MYKIGLVGGMGPVSTVDYYERIIRGFQKRYPHACPSIVIDSLDVFSLLSLEEKGNYSTLTRQLATSINNLKNAGADFAVLTANTPHIIFDELQKVASLPLISILDSTKDAIIQNKQHTVGLLGTKITMKADFYARKLAIANIKVVTPSLTQIETIHEIISNELELGIINPVSKKKILIIINDLQKKYKLEGLILGCTELPLILSQKDVLLTVYDTVELHVGAILKTLFTENLK